MLSSYVNKLIQPIKWVLPGPYDHDRHTFTMLTMRVANKWFGKPSQNFVTKKRKTCSAAGVDIIQFDEPSFNVFFDEVNDWGNACLEKSH